MRRQGLEVADIFHRHGAAWRKANAGHISLGQLQVMSAIEDCRSAVLGGHVERCEDCGHRRIAYNSCRNRHCPKCQGAAAKDWLTGREADLLPVGYFHLVFTLPAEVALIAYQNKTVVYDLLFRAAAEALLTIAADPRHLGARIGATAVLHSWGSAMTHHPHVHMIVPGGGLSLDGTHWVPCRPGFFLPVRVLSRVFRQEYLTGVRIAFEQGRLRLPGSLQSLAQPIDRAAWLAALAAKDWVVYAKPPFFGGPEQVLKYLARYTHRVAISNARLQDMSDGQVTFRYKDYADDHKQKTMTLSADEFLRRFMQHVLPKGFVKVRHYGLLANRQRAERLEQCRRLLAAANVGTVPASSAEVTVEAVEPHCCPKCGGKRLIYRELTPEEATTRSAVMAQNSS